MFKQSLALGILVFSATAHADHIDELTRAWMAKYKVPGLTLAVIKDGKITKQRGYGFSMLEHQVKAKTETAYELASVSKQFCATSIMMLVDQGKMSLEDPVSQYLPGTPTKWATMRVRHLLNHTSGIAEFPMDPFKASALTFLRYTNPTQLKDTEKVPLQFLPGQKFQYSNGGYAMAGMIVEKVSGEKYAHFLQAHIFTPLGMDHTRIIDPSAVIPNRAEGYTLRDGHWASWRMAITMSALDMTSFGGIISTVGDLAKWDGALGTDKLLKPASWQAVWTEAKLSDGTSLPYGLGWSLTKIDGRRIQEHSGFTGTFIGRSPDDHVTVIVLSNLGGGNPPPYGHDQSWPVSEFGELILKDSLPSRAEKLKPTPSK